MILVGKQIYLRPLTLEDVSEAYIAWMNDFDIVKYTESRFVTHTADSLKEFVRRANTDAIFTFAVVSKETDEHIGNIKLGPVDAYHLHGDIGLIIGKRSYFGRGIATESISLLSDFAFSDNEGGGLGLHKLTASAYATNIGSIKAFQKAGFEIIATRPAHARFEDSWVDLVLLEKLNPHFPQFLVTPTVEKENPK